MGKGCLVITHSSTLGLGLLANLLYGLLQRGRVGTSDTAVGLVAVLEEVEGGEGADAELHGEIGNVIGVELGEGVGVVDAEGVGVLDEHGRDGLAGTTPGCAGLDGDEGGLFDELIKLILGRDGDDGHFGGVFFFRGSCSVG